MITIYSKKKEVIEFLHKKIEFSEYKIISNKNPDSPFVFIFDSNEDVRFISITFSPNKAFIFIFIFDLMISLINVERKRMEQIAK